MGVTGGLNTFYKRYKGKYVDKYGNSTSYVQNNEPYGGQCASLARWWVHWQFGYKGNSYGDAKDYVNLPDSKIVKQSEIRNGDLVVYPTISQWGHVGIVKDGQMFNQNPYKARLEPFLPYKKVFVRPTSQVKKEPRKSTFIVGDRVKIINYGNSKPDGTGGQTGGITGNRTVSKVLYGQRYPYKLVAKNGEVGYYDAKALKMVKAMV